MKKVLILVAFAALLIVPAAQANPVSGSLFISSGSPTVIQAQYSIPKGDLAVVDVACADWVSSQTTLSSAGIQFRQLWYSAWDTPPGESCTASLSYTGAKGLVVLATKPFVT